MSVSIESIVEPLAERERGAALRRLLAMCEDRPDAGPQLARLLGGTQLVSQRIKLGYGAYDDARPPFHSARDAIEESGFRVVHSSAVICVAVESLELEQTWPSEGQFWVWACTHSLMSMFISEGAGAHRDAAFAGTILRDIGQLLIRQHAGSDTNRIIDVVETGASVAEAERSVLGFTHLDAMRAIAQNWELDSELLAVFDEFPESGSLGRVFWKAKRTLHRLGINDPYGPLDVSGAPLHPELAQFIGSVGGVRGFVRLSSPYLAAAFISGEARADVVIDELFAA